MKSSINKIWLDLDGVFADFQSAFELHCGFPYYSDPKKAWSILENVNRLFLSLHPLNGAKEFYEEVKSFGVDIEFLTALPQLTGKLHTAPLDKRLWVTSNLDPKVEVTCVANWSCKKNFAKPNEILIDDSQRNIDQWVSSGGIGILHRDNKTTLHQLRQFLFSDS